MKNRILALVLIVALAVVPAAAMETTEIEENDTFETAQHISVNQFVSGNRMTSSDVDYYQIELDDSGYIALTFNHEYVEDNYTYWTVTLYNGDKQKLASYDFSGPETKAECYPIGVPAGTYYAKVDSYFFSDVAYALKINYTYAADWEKEFNDTFKTANEIEPNQFVSGSRMTTDDVDYYLLYLDGPGYINLIFHHEYVEANYIYWTVTLYDKDNKVLVYYDFKGRDTKIECHPIGIPAGTYYVKVDSYFHSAAPYSLKVNYTKSDAWETEFNDTFKTADDIVLNRTIYGSRALPDDVDYFKVQVDKPGDVDLIFEHDYVEENYIYWTATLYDADNQEIMSHDFLGPDTEDTVSVKNLLAGQYFVKINSYFHSDVRYSFMLSKGNSEAAEPEPAATSRPTPTLIPSPTPRPEPTATPEESKCDNGHTWGNWSRRDATCTSDGWVSRSCKVCGAKEEETLPATGHDYRLQNGYYVCSNCGDSYRAETEDTQSQKFSDWSSITHQKAVERCVELGVIRGLPDGSFKPEMNIDRASWAKLVYCVVNGNDNIDSSYCLIDTDLDDVDGNWAESYINYLYANDFVSGDGAGHYNPTNNVTIVEASKTLLLALGYDAADRGYKNNPNWDHNIMSDAYGDYLMLEIKSVDEREALTRDDAAQLIYNTLCTRGVDRIYNLIDSKIHITYERRSERLMETVFGVKP